MYVAPPMRMGAWTMAHVLRQRIEYYCYKKLHKVEDVFYLLQMKKICGISYSRISWYVYTCRAGHVI